MFDKLRHLFGRQKDEEQDVKPVNDFENLVVPNKHVNLVLANGIATNPTDYSIDKKVSTVAGQYVPSPVPIVQDGIYINLHGIMSSSDSYEEVLTRLIETEIHEMMHWGDDREGDDRYNGPEHQAPFNNIVYDIMDHCDQAYYDFRDPLSRHNMEWLLD